MEKIKAYLDEAGRISQLPAKQAKRLAVLAHLADKFSFDRDYTEKEVNRIIDQWHTFGDYFILRRELVDNGLLCRTKDGSRYWRETVITTDKGE